MSTIKLEFTTAQARLLKAAINAEIIKGQGTFLSDADVLGLGAILNEINRQGLALSVAQQFTKEAA